MKARTNQFPADGSESTDMTNLLTLQILQMAVEINAWQNVRSHPTLNLQFEPKYQLLLDIA